MKHNINKQEMFETYAREAVRDHFTSDYGRCVGAITETERKDMSELLFSMQDLESQKDIIHDIIDNFANNKNIYDHFCWCFPELVNEYFREEINTELEKAHTEISSEYNHMDMSELNERLLEDQLEKARLARDINLGRL